MNKQLTFLLKLVLLYLSNLVKLRFEEFVLRRGLHRGYFPGVTPPDPPAKEQCRQQRTDFEHKQQANATGLPRRRFTVCIDVGTGSVAAIMGIMGNIDPAAAIADACAAEGLARHFDGAGAHVGRARPGDLRDDVTGLTSDGPWEAFRGEPRADDIRQGGVGNCWFVCALSVLADCAPELLKPAFHLCERNLVPS